VVLLVGLFAVRGILRGTISQIFGLLGLLAGLWVAGWIARWVGGQWSGARPAGVFWVLRWLVAGLGGLAVASVISWWGQHLGKAARATPGGWLDRVGGLALGATIGLAVATFTLMVALQVPLFDGIREHVVESRLPVPMLRGAAQVCAVSDDWFPGTRWLQDRFREAARRASRTTQVI
jgi:uncharacterized membrane protein required for colicin V production